MSWAGLANNQIVSFNNLQDAVTNGYFTALTTIPASNEEITKTDASTYVNCLTDTVQYSVSGVQKGRIADLFTGTEYLSESGLKVS